MLVGVALVGVAGLGPVAWQATYEPPAVGTVAPIEGYGDPRTERHAVESDVAYAERMTVLVASATGHCEQGDTQTWATAVTSTFLGPEGVIVPAELRCGFCSQVALVLAEILRVHGIESADAFGLEGHVVTEFESDGQTYVADPDLGVPPFAVDWSDPEDAVRAAYAAAGPLDWVAPTAETAGALYASTADNGEYDRDYYTSLAEHQERVLTAVRVGRLTVVGLGVALVLVALRRRREATGVDLGRDVAARRGDHEVELEQRDDVGVRTARGV